MTEYTAEECQRATEIEAMAAVPKGKPSPEEKAKVDEQKKARVAFVATLREKYSIDAAEGDKKIVKAILSQAEKFAAAAAAADNISLQPPSGTRDFYPDDMRLQAWLFEQFHAVAREMGFQVTPFLLRTLFLTIISPSSAPAAIRCPCPRGHQALPAQGR